MPPPTTPSPSMRVRACAMASPATSLETAEGLRGGGAISFGEPHPDIENGFRRGRPADGDSSALRIHAPHRADARAFFGIDAGRSEERRVGKEGRSRWAPH